jgi:hypothetical protein
MARRVFFSFHYERDVWRASQVRNSWVTKGGGEAAGFWDAGEWESIKKQGEEAIKRWINRQLKGTSVTVVLIGAETYDREWVRYEIWKSCCEKNGLLGVYIHNIRDNRGSTDRKGRNPFEYFSLEEDGTNLAEIFPTYDWVHDGGYALLGEWIEDAARRMGR